MTVTQAAEALEIGEDEVEELMEADQLPWMFNIAGVKGPIIKGVEVMRDEVVYQVTDGEIVWGPLGSEEEFMSRTNRASLQRHIYFISTRLDVGLMRS